MKSCIVNVWKEKSIVISIKSPWNFPMNRRKMGILYRYRLQCRVTRGRECEGVKAQPLYNRKVRVYEEFDEDRLRRFHFDGNKMILVRSHWIVLPSNLKKIGIPVGFRIENLSQHDFSFFFIFPFYVCMYIMFCIWDYAYAMYTFMVIRIQSRMCFSPREKSERERVRGEERRKS